MRKYHIADFLTLCEVICTCILILLIIIGATPQVALIVFGIGELCDAFDGICARRWKYPKDQKYRWWREYAPEIDQVTDVCHLIVMALFFIFRVCREFQYLRPWVAFAIALSVALTCIFIQVVVLDPRYQSLTARLILGRRLLYLACIAFIIFTTLYATTWSIGTKRIVTAILFISAIGLVIIKRNRLTQVKTPLE